MGLRGNRRHPLNRPALVAALLLVVALGVRIVEVARTSVYRPINDGSSYLRLAADVARSGDYPTGGTSPGAGGSRGPTAYFPPAYPYFLAAVDLLDGHRSGGHAAVQSLRLVQALLGTLSVALVGLIALDLFGVTVALIALALAALYVPLIALGATLSAENLLVALELAAIASALRARRARDARRRTAWVALAGVLIGLATLTHENGVVLLIPLAIAVWPGRGRRAFLAPLVLVAVAAITIAPWTIRNAIVMHRFIPVADETGMTLAGTYNSASAANHRIPYAWRVTSVHDPSRLAEADLDARLRSRALRYVGDHPLAPLAVAYHNTRRLLELEGSFAWRTSAASIDIQRGLANIGVVCFWIVAVLALVGAFTQAARRAPSWLWTAPLLLYLSVVFVNAETPRFRAPLDPFLLLLAALALANTRALARP